MLYIDFAKNTAMLKKHLCMQHIEDGIVFHLVLILPEKFWAKYHITRARENKLYIRPIREVVLEEL